MQTLFDGVVSTHLKQLSEETRKAYVDTHKVPLTPGSVDNRVFFWDEDQQKVLLHPMCLAQVQQALNRFRSVLTNKGYLQGCYLLISDLKAKSFEVCSHFENLRDDPVKEQLLMVATELSGRKWGQSPKILNFTITTKKPDLNLYSYVFQVDNGQWVKEPVKLGP